LKKASVALTLLLLMAFMPVANAQVTCIIKSLPSATPQSDSIFICGSFNNWNVKDEKYLLHCQTNGKYAITLPDTLLSFQYKFTRGSWLKVETNARNEYIENRVFQSGDPKTVYITIENWLDLGGVKKTNYWALFLFAMAVYGLALLFFLMRIEKADTQKLKAYLSINILLIASLFGAVLFEQSNLIWQSYVSMFSHLLLFVWGPLLYGFYTTQYQNVWAGTKTMFLIPLMLLVILHVFRLFNVSWLNFYSIEINHSISLGGLIVLVLAVVYNLVYLLKTYFVYSRYHDSLLLEPEHKLLKILLLFFGSTLIVFTINFIVLLTSKPLRVFQNYTFFFIYLSIAIVIQFYFILRYPEILKAKLRKQEFQVTLDFIKRMEDFIVAEKPYKNPQLTIAELSTMLDIKPYMLSRILNEHYNKKFRDYINEYRVNDFIELVRKNENKNFTFLALAHDVGFNSKSTFNLAFKKITNLSPREYMKVNHLPETNQTS
jgi:AraC-like DNA-binding protein